MAGSFWTLARERPDDPGVVDAFRTLSWAEFDERVNRFANALGALGLETGDHIAVLMGNRAEFLEAYGAIFKTGRYLTGINWHYKVPEVAYVLSDCDARVFVVDEAYREVGLEAAEEAGVEHVFVTGGPYEDLVAAHPADPPPEGPAGVWMPYTGGTTGRPKGVWRPLPSVTPDEAVELRGRLGKYLHLHPGGVHLVTGPMYHNAPMGFSSGTIHRGQTQVLMRRWDSREALEAISEHGVTSTHMVPTMFQRLLNLPADERSRYDTSSLEAVIHGAAPCPKWVKRAMIEWLGPVLVEYYGATEGGLTVVTSEEWLERPGTVGRPLPAWEVDVRDEDGRALPAGEDGVIWFRRADGRPSGFAYYKNPGQTDEVHADEATFTAGDIGHVDADGYVYLVDRKKEMIISGGVNIYPAEVEEGLSRHPDVLDVCVFGIPNEEWGEEVKGAVVLREGSDLTGDELIAWARERMAHYKVPRTVDFVEALPRDETGKLFRRELRDAYWKGRETAI